MRTNNVRGFSERYKDEKERMINMTLVKIAYASMTGNTEGISEHLEEAFKDLGVDVVREEADDVEDDFFEDADVAVVATYTDGDGELPFTFEDFFEELPDQDLSDKIFGVVGSGDSELYPDYFCHAAISFEGAFGKTGATKGAETLKIENDAEEEDIKNIQQFAKTVLSAVQG